MPLLLFIIVFIFSAELKSQENTMGLIHKNSDEVADGYTLLGNNEFTYLIDNCGLIINQWESNFKGGLGQYLMDDGSLLRAGKTDVFFDAGGASGVLERFSWEGLLEWQYIIADENQQLHHDIEVLPNGNILCSVWERLSKEKAESLGRIYDHELWNEKIIEIKMIGSDQAEIVWEWNTIDHVIQDFNPDAANYGIVKHNPSKLNINYLGSGSTLSNWLHINSIDYNEEQDQILISSRHLSEFYIIDHSTTILEAASNSGGKSNKGGDILFRYGNPAAYDSEEFYSQVFFEQHDVNWLANETTYGASFSIYNNEFKEFSNSQILVIEDPANEQGSYNSVNLEDELSVRYNYTAEGFYSHILSGVTILGNGNKFITEGFKGRVFELNESDEIVWDYIFPVNQNGGPGIQGGETKFNYLFKALKYPSDSNIFSGFSINPKDPIELLPIINECYSGETSNGNHLQNQISLKSNLMNHFLMLQNSSNKKTTISIYNSIGQLVSVFDMLPGISDLDVSHFPKGIYFISYQNIDNENVSRRFTVH